MAEVAGLPIVTISDAQLSGCYTLFVVESAAVPTGALETLVTTLRPADHARQSVIRDVEEKRERQLAELKAQFAAKTGRTFDTWNIEAAAFAAGSLSAVDDYERARSEPIGCTTRRVETTESLP
jgi:hypothetical protein